MAGAYDVSPDGEKIVINTKDRGQIDTPVKLLVNWPEMLKKRSVFSNCRLVPVTFSCRLTGEDLLLV